MGLTVPIGLCPSYCLAHFGTKVPSVFCAAALFFAPCCANDARVARRKEIPMGLKIVTTYHRQIEQFFAKIQGLGYKDTDFSVRCLEWPFTAKPPTAVSDLIVIKRTSNEIEVAYAADDEGSWVLSFVEDLNNGAFDVLEATLPALSAVTSEHESESQV